MSTPLGKKEKFSSRRCPSGSEGGIGGELGLTKNIDFGYLSNQTILREGSARTNQNMNWRAELNTLSESKKAIGGKNNRSGRGKTRSEP